MHNKSITLFKNCPDGEQRRQSEACRWSTSLDRYPGGGHH